MATKLLLIEDVDNLGRSGDVVSVKPGYARNFLVPKGFGVAASKHTLRMQERLQAERAKKAAEDKKEAEIQAKQLATVTLETTVKTDAEGHMYGSVAALDLVQLLAEQGKVEVDKRAVQLKHPIKKLGVHTVELRLREGVEASVQIKVMNEDGDILNPEDKAKAAAEAEAAAEAAAAAAVEAEGRSSDEG